MFRSICSETAKSSTFTHLVKLCLASRDETDTQTLISRSKNKSGGPRNSLLSKIRENYAEFIGMLEFLGPLFTRLFPLKTIARRKQESL